MKGYIKCTHGRKDERRELNKAGETIRVYCARCNENHSMREDYQGKLVVETVSPY